MIMTVLLIWVVLGSFWTLFQLHQSGTLSGKEVLVGIFNVVMGPVAPILYGVSYLVYRIRQPARR